MPLEYQANQQTDSISAVAIDRHVKNWWSLAIRRKNPLLDALFGQDSRRKKSFQVAPSEMGLNMLIPIGYDNVDSFTSDSLFVDPTVMPDAFPAFDEINGSTLEKYPMSYFQRSLGFTPEELDLFNPGFRQNMVQNKIDMFMTKWIKNMEEQIASSTAASKRKLQGLPHGMSASNTVGGISQTANPWHRARLVSVGGTITETLIDNVVDIQQRYAGEEATDGPDLMLADNVEDGLNVYGRLRALIRPQLRIQNTGQGKFKYNGDQFELRGTRVVQNWSGVGGELQILTTSEMIWWGPETPQLVSPLQYLPGSAAKAQTYKMWCGWGCRRWNLQAKLTGING